MGTCDESALGVTTIGQTLNIPPCRYRVGKIDLTRVREPLMAETFADMAQSSTAPRAMLFAQGAISIDWVRLQKSFGADDSRDSNETQIRRREPSRMRPVRQPRPVRGY